jgi:hypothetical protein
MEGKIVTVREVAALEQVSTRMVQRYCREGFQGHILPSIRVGKSLVIAESDYRAWRIACGFEQPEPEPQPQVSQPEESLQPIAPPAPMYPPWPLAADPHGELTNGPSEHSRNWPHPLACEAHRAEQLRRQMERLRGYEDEN